MVPMSHGSLVDVVVEASAIGDNNSEGDSNKKQKTVSPATSDRSAGQAEAVE